MLSQASKRYLPGLYSGLSTLTGPGAQEWAKKISSMKKKYTTCKCFILVNFYDSNSTFSFDISAAVN
jgi:hypothetical protein